MNTNLRPGLKVRSRILTLNEANRMLPLLERIVGDIRSTWDQIIERRTRLEVSEKEPPDGRSADREARLEDLKRDLNALIDRINRYIREVEELGCFVEEFKRGVINFPSLYLGRKVFLCWSPGDPSVRHWHELDESYNERSPIRDTRDFLVDRPE